MYRDTTNVEPEMYDYTNNNWSHWNSNEKLKENLEAVQGKHSIDSLQKTAILGTSHITRKVLQCEAWSLSGGDHRWFKRSTGKKGPWQETFISYYNNNNNNNNNNLINIFSAWPLLPTQCRCRELVLHQNALRHTPIGRTHMEEGSTRRRQDPSTCKNTTRKRDKYPCLGRNSNS